MNDLNSIAARFMTIVPERRRERAERALRTVMTAYEAGSIFNVDYKDAKDTLNRAVDDGYEEHIQKPYLWGKGGDNYESEVAYKLGSIMGLHNCISASKRLAKLNVAGKFGDDLRTFFDAATPLAKIMAELKAKVVKGRKPNPEATARRIAMEAKKTIRTCSVCFRRIAVLPNGLIADHGYRLPRQWMKTASCYGRQFRPLEVSSDGLVFMIDLLTKEIARLNRIIGEADSLKVLRKQNFRGQVIETKLGDPTWHIELREYVSLLKSELRHAGFDLGDYQRKLASWKPTLEGQRYGGGKRRHGNMHGVEKLHSEVRGLLRK